MARKLCESCGMPLKDSVKGKKRDGTPSFRYCHFCYKDGKFIAPDATAQQMRQYSIEGMTNNGWPKLIAKLMTINISKLPRWQQVDTSKPVD